MCLSPNQSPAARLLRTLAVMLIVLGWGDAASASQPPEFADAVRAIRAVGPEGRGNADATEAWRVLAAGDATNLTAVLEAMDGANDFAVNWLRAAFDSIVGRTLDAGRSAPVADLGLFVLDTRHNPRARRLGFDLMARLDAATANKLLAGMLNDPALELRCDAVQKVIDQADQSLSSSNAAGATLLYQQALNASRDVDQIDHISKKLEGLGRPVDSLKLFGFLTQWRIIAPFDNTGKKGFDTAFPPEQQIDFAQECDGKTNKVKWRDYVVSDKFGKVDMNDAYGKLKEVTAYAATEFVSDRDQSVELRLGTGNSWKVWLNGKLLFGRDEYHYDSEIDQYSMPAQLQRGPNTILVKICQNELKEDWTVDWDFQLRVTDSLGDPIPSAAIAKAATPATNPQ